MFTVKMFPAKSHRVWVELRTPEGAAKLGKTKKCSLKDPGIFL